MEEGNMKIRRKYKEIKDYKNKRKLKIVTIKKTKACKIK